MSLSIARQVLDTRPMNGQRRRMAAIEALFAAFPVRACLETGAYHGETTRWLQEASGRDTYSCEPDLDTFLEVQRRIREAGLERRIHVQCCDGVRFLREFCREPEARCFFYLDGHHFGPAAPPPDVDFPVREEVRLIAERFRSSLVLIDDAEVPGDSGDRPDDDFTGYGFEDYHDGRALTVAYTLEAAGTDFEVFYPVARSEDETGLRTGCALLASTGDAAAAVATLPTFWRRYP